MLYFLSESCLYQSESILLLDFAFINLSSYLSLKSLPFLSLCTLSLSSSPGSLSLSRFPCPFSLSPILPHSPCSLSLLHLLTRSYYSLPLLPLLTPSPCSLSLLHHLTPSPCSCSSFPLLAPSPDSLFLFPPLAPSHYLPLPVPIHLSLYPCLHLHVLSS